MVFVDISHVYNPPDFSRKPGKVIDILPVDFPVADRVRVFLSPLALDALQFE